MSDINISVKSILSIACPIILSSFSFNFMIFCDRAILAHYNILAMNSVAAMGMLIALFQYSAISIASMSEVVSGHLNGAKETSQVASPAWQMIWFGIICGFIFIFITYIALRFLISDIYYEHAAPFFRILMPSIFISVIYAAIAGFFVAIGKVKIIAITTLIGNILNILLDYLLIFGVEGFIPEYGTAGAAIATVCSMLVQTAIIFWIFYQDHSDYGSRIYNFNYKYFTDCINVGFPSAVSHITEMSAWNVCFMFITAIGEQAAIIYSLGISVFLLLSSIIDGIQKAVISFSANLLGANLQEKIRELISNAIKLHFIFVAIISFIVFSSGKYLLKVAFDLQDQNIISLDDSYLVLKLVLLFFTLDGIVWILYAVLIASKDTKFIMYTSGPIAWIAVVLPVYILKINNLLFNFTLWKILCIYPLILIFILYRRNINKNIKS